jgi:methylenetetrahydrofolate reductase (NADPH)
MKLTTLFNQGTFVITGEVGPIKGAIHRDKSIEPSCAIEALHLHQHVHAVNVTDNQSAVMRLGSLAASVRLKTNGIEPVYQLTCRDRNRLALQSDLLTAYSLGIDNVLLLTGDHIQLGDHKEAKPVFDLDSVQLIDMAKGLKKGYDISGSRIENYIDMDFGAVVNPNSDPLEQFNCPIMVGIVILKSPQMAKFMNKNVSGVHVPEELIKEIGSVAKEDRRKKSGEIAGRFVKEVKSMCQGVHIMPLGWTDIVPDILGHAGISK